MEALSNQVEAYSLAEAALLAAEMAPYSAVEVLVEVQLHLAKVELSQMAVDVAQTQMDAPYPYPYIPNCESEIFVSTATFHSMMAET